MKIDLYLPASVRDDAGRVGIVFDLLSHHMDRLCPGDVTLIAHKAGCDALAHAEVCTGIDEAVDRYWTGFLQGACIGFGWFVPSELDT